MDEMGRSGEHMMHKWNNEQEARREIKALVADFYYEYKKREHPFKSGDRIVYSSRVYDEKEMQSLTDAMLDFWLTSGRFSDEFEKNFSDWIGVKYTHLVNSGSSANLIAFSVLTAPELGERRKKKMLDFLKNRDDCFRQTLLIVLFSLALFYIRHIPMTIINDDLYNTTTGLTTIEFFMHNFKGVGRIFCNGMAWLIYRIPFGLWKVLDSFIYLVIAYLLSYLLEKRYFSWFCLGVCCFPIEKYLSTAGYIVCTTNYIYPFLGLLIALIPLRVAYDRKKQKSFYYVISFIALLYAANNDSFGIGMILFCLCFVLIFSFKNTEEKPIKEMRLAGNRLLLIATIAYLINFFIPGHIDKMKY